MKTKESNIKKEIRKNGPRLFDKYYTYTDPQSDLGVWLHLLEGRNEIPKIYTRFFKK